MRPTHDLVTLNGTDGLRRRDAGGDRWHKFGHGLSPEVAAKIALAKLQEARDLLKIAGATRAVDRVRLAITSAGGAVRHAQGKAVRNQVEG